MKINSKSFCLSFDQVKNQFALFGFLKIFNFFFISNLLLDVRVIGRYLPNFADFWNWTHKITYNRARLRK